MTWRKWVGLACLGIVALSGLTAGAAYVSWRMLNTPLQIDEEPIYVDVRSGMSWRAVTAELGRRGIVTQPRLLALYGRLTGDATRIHAGEYALRRGMTPLDMLRTLVAGQVVLHQLTIIEGWRFDELLLALREHPAVDVTTLDAAAIMDQLGSPGVHPEGQFLPDTYRFAKGTSDVEVLRTAHEALQQRLAAAWDRRSPGLPLQSAYEALTLASIIEKETALGSERRKISGVFTERLRRGMRLQTDPTVIYGLGDKFDGNLRKVDLSTDTPYNTYTRAGLPPTPIALPSASSIEAAVLPEDTGALYFVATGLPDGSHYFSATLEEHNSAVRRYLDRLRDRSDP
jgi:UPF0755 protein